jgi:hypothetical protein
MKKTEARDAILDYLFQIYEPDGFKIQKKEHRIYKKTDFGWLAIVLPMTDYNPLIKFNFLFLIRHNIINNKFEELMNMDKRYRNSTSTIVTHLCNFTEETIPYFKNEFSNLKTNGDFEATTLNELEIILAAIKTFLEMGKEYFRTYSELLNINKRLNVEHKDEMVYPYHGHIKLLVAQQCDDDSLSRIHEYNLGKMIMSLDYVKAEYVTFYDKVIGLK